MLPPAKEPWREWMQQQSDLLMVSFRASSGIEHTTTKGDTREAQVIDVFKLLPERVTPFKNVVIVDCEGTQSPKFDGVLLDRANLPLMADLKGTYVAMIESVGVCFEVKSNLDKGDLEDMFVKTQKLRSMNLLTTRRRPMVAGIAYTCSNINLRFFDYAVAFWRSPATAPVPVCVLEQAVFAAAKLDTDELALQPDDGAMPIMLSAGKDSLLTLMYLLFSLVTLLEAPWKEVARGYSREFLSDIEGDRFNAGFLDLVTGDEAKLGAARRAFEGHKGTFDDAYNRAREAVGLPTTNP